MDEIKFEAMNVSYAKSSIHGKETSLHYKENPTWKDIQQMIHRLEANELRISLDEGDESKISIMIDGKPGNYTTTIIRGEEGVSMVINPYESEDDMVFIMGDDCPKNLIVHDINLVVEVIQHFILTREFLHEYSGGIVTWKHDDEA